jgi:hypothetical protein
MKMPTNAEVNAVTLPHYDAAQQQLIAVVRWARAGFPGATLSELVQIAKSNAPELARAIRLRGEKDALQMLRNGEV